MCYKCNKTPYSQYSSSQLASLKSQQKMQAAYMVSGMVSNFAGGLISIFLNNSTPTKPVSSYSSTTTPAKVTVTPAPAASEEAEETPEAAEEKMFKMNDTEIKSEVQKLLQNRITNLDDETLNELVKKYREIKTANPDYDDKVLAIRLENFVKGKINHQKTVSWSKTELEITKDAKNVKPEAAANALSEATEESQKIDLKKDNDRISMDKLKSLSLQVMSYADSNNNESLDLIEFFRKDLISHYQVSENIDINAATTKAETQMKTLNLNTNDDVIKLFYKIQSNGLGELNDEEAILMNSVLQFSTLNVDKNDSGLDLNELMAYHATVANFNTEDNKIDQGDYSLFNSSMLEDIQIRLEDGTIVIKNEYMLKNYYDAIKAFNSSNAK